MATMFPWFTHLMESDKTILGTDWWPYGIDGNRKALGTVLRYHFEQGITDRQYTIEEIFVPELLNS
jgi:4,5-dihydroxyphthalate decarboxylase